MQQSPDKMQEAALSNERKSQMLSRHVTYEKECLLCKLVCGSGFVGFAAFNIWRARSQWPYMHSKDKAFNFFAIGFIFGMAGLNYMLAYRIHMGQQMDLIELRPSYSERLRQSYQIMNMTEEEKREYVIDQLKFEEEKAEVKRYLIAERLNKEKMEKEKERAEAMEKEAEAEAKN